MNISLKFLISFLTILIGYCAMAVEEPSPCEEQSEKVAAIKKFLADDYNASISEVYKAPNSENFNIRFYPGDQTCIGAVSVNSQCEVGKAAKKVLFGGQVESRLDFTCFVPDEEQEQY